VTFSSRTYYGPRLVSRRHLAMVIDPLNWLSLNVNRFCYGKVQKSQKLGFLVKILLSLPTGRIGTKQPRRLMIPYSNTAGSGYIQRCLPSTMTVSSGARVQSRNLSDCRARFSLKNTTNPAHGPHRHETTAPSHEPIFELSWLWVYTEVPAK
jgi:hypothetical protein